MKPFFLFFVYGVFVLAFKSVWTIPCDFLLIAVIFFAFYEERLMGLALSLLLGFLLDVASLSPLGTAFFSYTLVFGLIRFFKNKILFQTALSRFCWVAVFSFVHDVIYLAFLNFIGDIQRPFSIFLPQSFVESLINGALGTFWFPFLQWYRYLTWAKLVKPRDVLLKK